MDRLISLQAAIDAANRTDYRGLLVEDVTKVTDEVVKELKKLPSAQPELPIKQKCTICPHCDNCDVNDDGTISHPEPQWIPCSERLPESTHECSGTDFDGELFYWKESDWVLAQRSTGEMVVAEYSIGDRGGYWETMDNHDINVLAWMPLPEPWRGEKDGLP